ncbi:LuxR family transcriptional regulator [Nocardioides seonyuensis]|uniref:LuxR family transcriptional regulator n=1 Tax=Nocardioides seonyuensis TaxID=2518371 RepID=A0A4P7IDG2_9ACTN|nr:LuxR family transcriptional regulator [Nocardioides seonyuensis]QBX55205.1 LuxR family transcriptional regulator [Nocardioides seonyuensis]
MSFDSDHRALFESEASPLYEEIVLTGRLSAGDARIVPGGELAAAFELLREIGLVTRRDDSDDWVAVDPAAVQAQVVAPLGQQGAELIAESAHWAQAFTTLTHAWRRSPNTSGEQFTSIRGGETISGFVASLVSEAEEELLTAQPQNRRNIKGLADVVNREISVLRRGVRMRTLYQHAARRSSDTRKYVVLVSAEGAEVRTLDEFFNRLIVVDRRIAVIPSHEGLDTATVIREPSMVAYLVDMFERHWERARPFASGESSLTQDIAAEQRAMTIRMLLEGRPDPAGATRLGVSPRTYAGYVADLKAEFDAETRFQLGYAMGKLGISGREIEQLPRRAR